MFKTKQLWMVVGLVAATAVATAQAHRQVPKNPPPVVGGQIQGIVGDAGFPVCFGDGTAWKCPAKNLGLPGHGCDNGAGTGGAVLMASGFARLSDDSVVLSVAGLPPGTTVIYLQADRLADQPKAFGYGLMCMTGPITRLAMKRVAGSDSSFPEPGDLSLSRAGNIPKAGGSVIYQVLYRDVQLFTRTDPFNLSNAWWTAWSY